MPLPTAKEFRTKFIEAFSECSEEARRRSFDEAWKNWTAFMTGKQTKVDSCDYRAVLPTVAGKLNLELQREFMNLDLVLYEKKGCPVAVAIEHENDLRGIEDEMDKLFSVRSRLKVLVIYAWNQNFINVKDQLETRIRNYYKYYVSNQLPESPKAEYLFLLGDEKKPKSIAWHCLSFDVSGGPEKQSFQVSH